MDPSGISYLFCSSPSVPFGVLYYPVPIAVVILQWQDEQSQQRIESGSDGEIAPGGLQAAQSVQATDGSWSTCRPVG